MTSELPSLNFPSPAIRGGGSRTRSSSRGRGGKGRGHYSALDLNDMDDIPLVTDRGVASSDDEEAEEEEKEEGEGRMWHQLGGRRRWQQRIRSHSTLLGLICGGGWQVLLTK